MGPCSLDFLLGNFTGFIEIKKYGKVFRRTQELFKSVGPVFFLFNSFEELFSRFGIIPKSGSV